MLCYLYIFGDIYLLRCTVVERRSMVANLPCAMLDLQLMGNHYCGQTIRYRSAKQANSAFHPFGVDR